MDIQVDITIMTHAQDVMEEVQLQLHHVHMDIAHHIGIVLTIQIQRKHHIHIVHMVKHHSMINLIKLNPQVYR